MPTDNVPVKILLPVTNVKTVLLNITTLPIAAIVRNLFYPAHQIQQIPNLQILNFHQFFNPTDFFFFTEISVQKRLLMIYNVIQFSQIMISEARLFLDGKRLQQSNFLVGQKSLNLQFWNWFNGYGIKLFFCFQDFLKSLKTIEYFC